MHDALHTAFDPSAATPADYPRLRRQAEAERAAALGAALGNLLRRLSSPRPSRRQRPPRDRGFEISLNAGRL
ncbi:hypothetical protein [Prosthecodimorpha staleyi]|uniref:Uncharacterized protein n=1 Tax=Prosthecodimorpha staleyi TaxID=2840188 RepID=A0A947DAY2_9HYPH|nr:hypothetical protein [Prosthecodimorpha staleyi]MBT9290594.1 hypothetical protein [Prosthecodimorpha staleyi]